MCNHSNQWFRCEKNQHECIYHSSHQEYRVVHVFGGMRQIDFIYDGIISDNEFWLVKFVIVCLQYVHEQYGQIDHYYLKSDRDKAGYQCLEIRKLHVVDV